MYSGCLGFEMLMIYRPPPTCKFTNDDLWGAGIKTWNAVFAAGTRMVADHEDGVHAHIDGLQIA